MRMISVSRPHARVAEFDCEVDAEPLERYRRGGYHPTHIGDTFKDGRYRIIDKLGWGGYGTVWLARDKLLDRYAALKLLVSEVSHNDHETQILERLSQGLTSHPGKKHIVQLLDNFKHKGPNGVHECLVLELLGPSVIYEAERRKDNRLSAEVAWEACKQTAQALEYVHANNIAHGDLHPGNIMFANPSTAQQSESDHMTALGAPETGDVHATYGSALTPCVPKYLVVSKSLPFRSMQSKSYLVKIVDFGQARVHGHRREIHCPLVFQPPEAVLTGEWGTPADVWSLGCTMFELIVGYPPFDNFMLKKHDLIQDWVSMFGPLPEEWKHLYSIPEAEVVALDQVSLPDWLHDTYFDDDKTVGFAEGHIEEAGELLQAMMQYRPEDRPNISKVLQHAWFQKNPFTNDGSAG